MNRFSARLERVVVKLIDRLSSYRFKKEEKDDGIFKMMSKFFQKSLDFLSLKKDRFSPLLFSRVFSNVNLT